MAIESMQKVRLAVHRSISGEVADSLQKLGCCQFIPHDRGNAAGADAASFEESRKRLEDLLADVRSVMRFLEPYTKERGGGLAAMLGDVPSYTARELEKLADEDKFLDTAGDARILEKRVSDARTAMSRVSGLMTLLGSLKPLPYTLDFYTKGTDFVQCAIVQIPASDEAEFTEVISSALGESAELFILPAGRKEQTRTVSVLYARALAPEFQEALSRFQASRVEVPEHMTALASDELRKLNDELTALEADCSDATAKIERMADEAFRFCERCSDWWEIKRAKLDALLKGEQTEHIILSAFWIPQSRLEAFREVMKPFEPLSEIVMLETEEGDRPPTLLHNRGLAVPVEPLIMMYGTPTYGACDPSPVVAPFFYAIFGICFGDAAYGLIIALVLAYILVKKNVTGTVRKFIKIMILSNICALIFGALTFSWFGDSITAFSFLHFLKPLGKLQIMDPMNDPITMLIVSFAIGACQILAGMFLAMRENWRKGDRFAALADQGAWMLFLCSLVLFGLSTTGVIAVSSEIFKWSSIIFAVTLVATQGREKGNIFGKFFSGLLSLYNVSGYLGDVLSYSRLLALGLCSGAIGVVVNLLANLVSAVPYAGIPLGVLIFLVGHTFSLAINVLGAFVHTLRLQYVEFFGKFHSADGVEFTPLSVLTRYVKVSG
ncbi:MAG: V-type ATP synthase subunit I [Synergistaceae bacterium]|jgi:V/A-type H+-transporting ATPase subunit I|nr:V-type ATP synthase subunit I [Synergistaceae bacterium]